MPTLSVPGPVFEFEWLAGTRRWQPFALRAAFVASLLIALAMVWSRDDLSWRSLSVNRAQARLAMRAYDAIVGTQLALVLLAAPAATAGSICIDKARGTLAHVLVTDLTDAEIVLGKLAVRLVPVLMLIGCTMPVVSLCSLLGGIEPAAIVSAYAITAAVAVLGCSLALTLSIWARKTHEVLLTTYLIITLWLLVRPMGVQINWVFGGGYVAPGWVVATDPFELAFAAYGRPGLSAGPWDVAAFVAGCLLASSALLTLAVRRFRRVAATEAEGPRRRRRARWIWTPSLEADVAWLAGKLPGPSLDVNPVLWREWHRNRPSRWVRRIWGVYVGGAVFFTLVAIAQDFRTGPGPWGRAGASLWINGFQVAIGALLLSVVASTSLAEERARGSLDVLMATPLSTPAIVWGKWLGTFRRVPRLALLPGLLAASLAWGTGHWLEAALLVAYIVAYGAFLSSLGLALATWVPRLGRAVALCVAIDVLVTVGLFFVILVVFIRSATGERMLVASPFGAGAIITAEAAGDGPPPLRRPPAGASVQEILVAYGCEFTAIIAYAIAAIALMAATLRTFDPCLGRAAASPLSPRPRPELGRLIAADGTRMERG